MKHAIIKRMGMILAASACVAAIAGCSVKSDKEPFAGSKTSTPMTPEQAMAGAPENVQAIYKQSCLSCHASNMEGRVGPRTNLQQVGARLTREQIIRQIEFGGSGMSGYKEKLKPEEISALADWLSSKK